MNCTRLHTQFNGWLMTSLTSGFSSDASGQQQGCWSSMNRIELITLGFAASFPSAAFNIYPQIGVIISCQFTHVVRVHRVCWKDVTWSLLSRHPFSDGTVTACANANRMLPMDSRAINCIKRAQVLNFVVLPTIIRFYCWQLT